jgi:cell division protein FtsW
MATTKRRSDEMAHARRQEAPLRRKLSSSGGRRDPVVMPRRVERITQRRAEPSSLFRQVPGLKLPWKRSAKDTQDGARNYPIQGVFGPTPVRKLRPLRATRVLRGPSQAMMATRIAIEPDANSAVAAVKPAPDVRAEDVALSIPKIDMPLLAALISLLVLGTVFIYSASMYQDYQTFGDVNYYIQKQITWLIVGAGALAFGLRFDYQKLRSFSMLGLGLTALLLAMVHIPSLSYSHGGATRWIYIKGFTLQPSEIGKLALTIYAAHWLSSKDDEIKHSLKGLLPFGIVLSFTTLLIFRQPDLGTAAVISGAMLGMFFVSGARLRHLLALAALFLPVAYFVAHHGGYWSVRILAWRHPFADQQGVGYQISRALLAFWHGGFAGVGLGNGQMKDYVPAPQTDTIFATIGEETGLVGALIVVALFGFFAYRGIRISMLAKDPFGKLLAAGITTYLAIQALLNMLSVTNAIPFTGVPLPFISFGGSSLVVNLLAVGILLNVSRHIEPVPEERSDLTGTYLWWRNRRPHLPMPHRRSKPGQGSGSTWRERRLGWRR